MLAKTIDDVMLNLDRIIAADRSAKNRIAYFACLYRHVTAAVQAGIAAGNVFDDSARMQRLDVTFANRYFTALDEWNSTGKTSTQAWQLAFETASSRQPIVMQHLFLAMNAHINLDLGVAVAQTSPGDLSGMQKDFNTMNNILATLVPHVEKDLEHVWPFLTVIHSLARGDEDELLSFSMQVARVSAWSVAQRLAPMDAAQQAAEIQQIDAAAVELGKAILDSGFPLNLLIALFRRLQEGTVPQIIDALIDFQLQQDVIKDWLADASQQPAQQK
jgi:hypothetical protein